MATTISRPMLGAALAAAAWLLVTAAPASGGVTTIRDGNDRPGPLDLKTAAHGHAGARVTHTITTFGRWSLGLLGPSTPNSFTLLVSTDRDPAPERIVAIFSAQGRMLAIVVRPNGRFVGAASASKPNGRTVRVSIARGLLGNPAGYRWQAFSFFRRSGPCSQVCVDSAPNGRGSVLHDIKAPAVSFPALGVPETAEYDVRFSVSDAGGGGFSRWRLEHRPLGQAAWSTMAQGTSTGQKTHHHVGAVDADDQFRVVAVDRHRNTTTSPVRLVSVPLDEDVFTYAGTWAPGGQAGDFMGTAQTSSDTGTPATATYEFTGRFVGLVARGGSGTADVSLTGDPTMSVDASAFPGSRRVIFQRSFPSVATRTIVVTVTGGPLVLDGIIVR